MLGAICGDILGSNYEFEKIKYPNPSEIQLMNIFDTFTDDTAMTLAVADWLLHDIHTTDDDEQLKKMLADRFVTWAFTHLNPRTLGFGDNFWQWLCKIKLIQDYTPINSFGNGSGMRVSPVGWFFDTLEETLRFAKLSADVSHNHPEGEKGAMCIAAAIFLARTGKSKKEIKDYLYETFKYEELNKTVAELRESCKWSEICQDTVPMSVVAFLESDDYPSAIQLAVSYGSDSDTIGDMSGAIAEAYYGSIPDDIVSFCLSKLPDVIIETCIEFSKKKKMPVKHNQ